MSLPLDGGGEVGVNVAVTQLPLEPMFRETPDT